MALYPLADWRWLLRGAPFGDRNHNPQDIPQMPTDDEFDYGADALTTKVGDNMMKSLINCADLQEKHETEIARLEELLTKEKDKLKQLSEITIPQLLDGVNGTFKLDDGRVLDVNEKIRASIAGEKAGPAVAWLDSHGHGNIVKREFVIQFNRDDEVWAKKFEADLKKRKKPLNVKRKHTVHPQTLEAFVREQTGLGEDLPKDTFGIYRQKITTVTRPDLETKARKSKKNGGDTPDF